jgi:hypothetical protein
MMMSVRFQTRIWGAFFRPQGLDPGRLSAGWMPTNAKSDPYDAFAPRISAVSSV